MNAPRTIVALLLLVLLLAGCGKKGPLYLPEPSAPTAVGSG